MAVSDCYDDDTRGFDERVNVQETLCGPSHQIPDATPTGQIESPPR